MLKFKDGKFKILAISDIHGVTDFDKRICPALGKLLDDVRPDFVFVLGDIFWDPQNDSFEGMKNFCDAFFAEIEKRNIYWSYVFGNHDSNEKSAYDQRPIYAQYKHCLYENSPEGVHGYSNYVLPIYNEAGDDIVYNIWALDTHDNVSDYCKYIGIPRETKWEHECTHPLSLRGECGGYDTLRFSQLMWYWNKSVELENKAGHKIPGLLGLHIPIPEYSLLLRTTAHLYFDGISRENVGTGPINSGLFNCILERGDIKTIIAGHDHINDYTGKYYGVTLTYDGGLSYNGYCHDDIRGGRVFEIDENDAWNIRTYMARVSLDDNV